MAKRWLIGLILILLLSPLGYLATGIGQKAHALSAELIVSSDGRLASSPKAVARHRLIRPLEIERLLTYPAILLLLQASGLAVWLREWVARIKVQYRRGFSWLNRHLMRLTNNRLTLDQLVEIGLFISLITLLVTLVYFPLSIYQSFVLRHQFGLSTQSFGGWLRDYWLRQGVSLVSTLVVFGGLYALIKVIPRRWPIWLGGGFGILFFGYVLLEPIIVTPLFYTISPVTDDDLRGRILTLADRANMKVDDIFIIDASSKTTAVNAYVTGYGRASKIGLWDNLLTKHPPAEVDVVIAHEMGHWYYRHVLIYSAGLVAGTWLGLFALRFWLNRVWRNLGWRGSDDVAGYPYLLGLIALLSLLSLPLGNGVSRLAENQADVFALEVSQNPAAFMDVFKNLAEENQAMIAVPAWEKFLLYTHPPISERIERAQTYLEREP